MINLEKDSSTKTKVRIEIKTVLLVFLATIFLSITQILYKLASKSFSFSIQQVFNFYLVGGILSCFIGGFMLLLALRKGDLSLVYPLSAFTYIFVTILSYYFLKEIISFQKWIGLVTITLGIITMGQEVKNE